MHFDFLAAGKFIIDFKNGSAIEKSNKFSRRRTAPAKRRNDRFWLFFEV